MPNYHINCEDYQEENIYHEDIGYPAHIQKNIRKYKRKKDQLIDQSRKEAGSEGLVFVIELI